MFISQVILILEILGAVNCDCDEYLWWPEYIYDNQVSCASYEYFRGLISGSTSLSTGGTTFFMQGASCCDIPTQWNFKEKVVEYTDWSAVLVNNNVWVNCPSGYFLAGFGRSGTWRNFHSDFSNIVSGRCVRPAGHPRYYNDCYTEDISDCFKDSGNCSCAEDYYVTGLYKSKGNDIKYLDHIRCCSMVQKPRAIQNFEDMATRIMEKTLWYIALLAEALGFSYTKGVRAISGGEDFIRVGDTWEANTRMFEKNQNCSQPKCQERLKIVYGNWSMEVMEIEYGQSVSANLTSEIIDSGRIHNMADSPANVSLDLSNFVKKTITHTVGKRFSTSPDLAVDFNFVIPLSSEAPLKYETKVQLSDRDVVQTSTVKQALFERKIEIVLGPNSSTSYDVTVRKRRTKIPYSAVLAVKFFSELRGYLRWEGTFSRPANYHSLHKDTVAPVYVAYRLGDQSVSFDSDLKKKYEAQSMPWLWEDVANVFAGRLSIQYLTDKKLYAFKINGTLDIVSESHLEVVRRDGPLIGQSI